MALARAVYSRPALILLDDVFSALDGPTGRAVARRERSAAPNVRPRQNSTGPSAFRTFAKLVLNITFGEMALLRGTGSKCNLRETGTHNHLRATGSNSNLRETDTHRDLHTSTDLNPHRRCLPPSSTPHTGFSPALRPCSSATRRTSRRTPREGASCCTAAAPSGVSTCTPVLN